ncbi:MAG TPA: twitching motility protein PilT [Methanomassiliicoccales archaeon]|nr:twitching motility protein PilT [Methanomassiliicoccales archaeon]
MQKVVLDTNALLMPFEFSLNLDLELKRILGQCEVYVPGPVIGELKRSTSKYAKMALELSRKYRRYETSIQGDAGIMDAAESLQAFVVTNDALLRAKLRRLGLKVIFLRSNNHLELDGDY